MLSFRKYTSTLGVLLFLFLLYPILIRPLYELFLRSVTNTHGVFVGFTNFIQYTQTAGLSTALYNTFFVATISAVVTVFLAFIIAYTLTHTNIYGKRILSTLYMLPIFVPSLVPAMGLIYLFGAQGICKELLCGYELYGPVGIILGLVVFSLPHATVLIHTGLQNINSQLYYAAASLNAGLFRQLLTITLPHARYSLISAFAVSFTIAFTDFGVPKVLGANYSVLATEMYSQVLGQQNFSMGATISILLLFPTVLTLLVDILLRKSQERLALQHCVKTTYTPPCSFLRDVLCSSVSFVTIIGLLASIMIVVVASFMAYWPYDYSFTTENYIFETIGIDFSPLLNSFYMSCCVGLIGVVFLFSGSYLTLRTNAHSFSVKLYRGLLLIPANIPGMVLGLAYIFAFNRPDSVLHVFYNSFILLVVNTAVHFSTVPHLAFSDSLSQLNRNFEMAGKTLGVSSFITFCKVIVPSCRHVIVDIFYYLFINSMTTLSAVVFFSSGKNMLASVTVMSLYDSGNMGYATAFCSYILAITISMSCVRFLFLHFFTKH